jgi:branched-chain amino acid transport system substrate-binding protein
MNKLGVAKITPGAMTAALSGFKGPQALGAPSLHCGKYKTEPAACNDQTQFFKYMGKGVFKRLTGWLRPPKNFTPQG